MGEYDKNYETIANDPISLVYSKLIEIALSNEYLAEKIKKGNVVRFDYKSNQNKPPEKVTTNDTPELTLGLQSFNIKKINSCNTTIEVGYNWLIITGDYRCNAVLNPVVFNLLKAMARCNDELVQLRYENEPFVMKVEVGDGQAGLVDNSAYAAMRNINGWSSSFPISVTLSFKHYEL